MQYCRRVYIFALLIAAFLVSSCAPVPIAPTRTVGALSAEQLKKLTDAKSALFLVDTRTEYEYRQGRLPGAINIPPYRFKELARLLPPDKDAKIVFYCRGGG